MKSAAGFYLVLVTAPDLRVARRLARASLEARLAACVNILRGIESHYWWRGKQESGSEVLLLFKTTKGRLGALEKMILEGHPYDTPEFLALRLDCGNGKYLGWLEQSCASVSL